MFSKDLLLRNQKDWAWFLLWAEYIQNYLCHSATQLKLFQCVLGYQLPLFPWNANLTDPPTVDEWFGWCNTQQCLEQVAQRNQSFANIKEKLHSFNLVTNYGYLPKTSKTLKDTRSLCQCQNSSETPLPRTRCGLQTWPSQTTFPSTSLHWYNHTHLSTNHVHLFPITLTAFRKTLWTLCKVMLSVHYLNLPSL